MISAVERRKQVLWVLVGCLFFPNPFGVRSDLCIMKNVWKIAVLITADRAKELSAEVCGKPGYASYGNCSLKGARLFSRGFQLVLRQKHFIFPECLLEKICETTNLHHLSVCLSFMLLLWEISGRIPAGTGGKERH